jgi:hypothetical protein
VQTSQERFKGRLALLSLWSCDHTASSFLSLDEKIENTHGKVSTGSSKFGVLAGRSQRNERSIPGMGSFFLFFAFIHVTVKHTVSLKQRGWLRKE